MIAALQRLGRRIDAAWRRAGFRTASFPAVAARCLSDFDVAGGDHVTELADWIIGRRTFPAACNPFGASGPPAFTVWSNERFFVNVYAYTTPEVVVHDHNFAGAFVNVAGRTVHCTWDFAGPEAVSPSVRIGSLDPAGVELIEPGAVRQIEPGQRFIHQVWHLSRPTVVLVIRTPPLPRRSLRQFQYLRPSIATEVFRDETLALGAPDRFLYASRIAECFRMSSNGPGGAAYVKRLVEGEEAWDAVWHVIENWRLLETTGALQEVIRRAARRHGAWFEAMERAGRRANLFRAIDWMRVLTEEDRMVMALLMTVESKAGIAEALQALMPNRRPYDVILESLQRLASNGAIPLTLNDERLVVLSCALRSDGRPEEWRRLVQEAVDVRDDADWTAVRDVERQLRAYELLQPLLGGTAA